MKFRPHHFLYVILLFGLTPFVVFGVGPEPIVSLEFSDSKEPGPRSPGYPGMKSNNVAGRFASVKDAVKIKASHNQQIKIHGGQSVTMEAWVKVKELKSGSMPYLIGRGRDDNGTTQNYAIRLKRNGTGIQLGYLFSSQDPENNGAKQFHRWWSHATFSSDGWHHVALVFTFGKKGSLRAYIDGKATKGTWDLGGDTHLPPVVNVDSDLVIGSGSSQNSSQTFNGDSVLNSEEFSNKTDPFLSDTDGDGVSDYDEINGYYVDTPTYTEEETTYFDYDWETGEEVEVTETYTIETMEEVWVTGNPRVADQGGKETLNFEIDVDQDGLNLAEEMALGTSDTEADSDFDGISDFSEVMELNPILRELGLPIFDPMDPTDANSDWDGDGISNASEYTYYGTDFLNPDSDFDGYSDSVEIAQGSDALNPFDPDPTFTFPIVEGETTTTTDSSSKKVGGTIVEGTEVYPIIVIVPPIAPLNPDELLHPAVPGTPITISGVTIPPSQVPRLDNANSQSSGYRILRKQRTVYRSKHGLFPDYTYHEKDGGTATDIFNYYRSQSLVRGVKPEEVATELGWADFSQRATHQWSPQLRYWILPGFTGWNQNYPTKVFEREPTKNTSKTTGWTGSYKTWKEEEPTEDDDDPILVEKRVEITETFRLSGLYSTPQLVLDTEDEIIAQKPEWVEQAPYAIRYLPIVRDEFLYARSKYKMEWREGTTDAAKHPVTHLVLFYPWEQDLMTGKIIEQPPEYVQTQTWDGESDETFQLYLQTDHRNGVLALLPVDLKIYNGQGAANPVPENDEETIGAFTVANLNDTDGDTKIDNVDNAVKKGTNGGADEEDLMQLVITGPKIGRMKVTVVSGDVEFWEKSTKETKKAKTGNAIFIDGADLPKTLWVEATDHSDKVRDIELKLGFEDGNGNLTDDIDKVKATAVWAEKKSVKNKKGDVFWPNADGEEINRTFQTHGGNSFGINLQTPMHGLAYTIGFEFTMLPAKIAEEPGVAIDITRQKEKEGWFFHQDKWTDTGKESLPLGDRSNDDAPPEIDEDVEPKDDMDSIYVIDGPGVSNNNGFVEILIRRLNFYEFVRIGFDGNRPQGNNSAGSRASSKEPWHAHMWLTGDGEKYNLKPGEINSVDEGHKELQGNHPE